MMRIRSIILAAAAAAGLYTATAGIGAAAMLTPAGAQQAAAQAGLSEAGPIATVGYNPRNRGHWRYYPRYNHHAWRYRNHWRSARYCGRRWGSCHYRHYAYRYPYGYGYYPYGYYRRPGLGIFFSF